MCVCLHSCLSYPACKSHLFFFFLRRFLLPPVTCLALPYLSTLSHKWYDFRRQMTKHKMPALIFSTSLVWNISHPRKIHWDVNINLHRSAYKVPVILVRFSSNLNFLGRFSKHPQISNIMNLRPVAAELFHADRQTDMTKVTVALRNF